MENFICTLLALNYSQIWKSCVLRATVRGNANVLSQSPCLGSTKKLKETKLCILGSEHGPLPKKQEQF